MPRYVAFSQAQNERSPNPLSDYQLATTELLPMYFGDINSVNIFLGENNSGKSRFMREIMRSSETRTVTDKDNQSNILNNIKELLIKKQNLESKLNIFIKTKNNARGSELENNFGDLFSKDLTMQENEIRLDKYWNKLENTSQIIKEYYSTIHNSIASNFENINELLEDTEELVKKYKKIRNIYKEIATHKYRLPYGSQWLQDVQNNGLQFQPIFWERNGHGHSTNLEKSAEHIMDEIGQLLNNLSAIQLQLQQLQASITSPTHRTYIPALRTARTLVTNQQMRLEADNDIFLYTTTHDYDLADSGVIINTGLSLYDAIDTTRNARTQGRDSFAKFEQFLSEAFFNSKPVAVVAERVRDARGGNILVSVGGVERDIHDLGDGIQAIIMLLYPLFIAPQGAWFFIEEPETHLHPGFQRLFIETITSNPVLRAKQLTIFFTTHSNHILDFALDEAHHVNVFTFRRQQNANYRTTFQIQLSDPRDLQNLNALGVQNSSVFLSNCTLWVEGITDRLYLRAYLQAYWQHLQAQEKGAVSLIEGLHYAFLEYAGSNVDHYQFSQGPSGSLSVTPQLLASIRALPISNRIMLIADKDANKQPRHDRRAAQQHDGFVYHVLPVREIENLLSPQLLGETLTTLYPRQQFDTASLKQSSYANSYLGSYLRGKYNFLPDTFAPRKGSGTIGSTMKRKFAEAATQHITWEKISKPAQQMAKEIHKFILAHNTRLGSN